MRDPKNAAYEVWVPAVRRFSLLLLVVAALGLGGFAAYRDQDVVIPWWRNVVLPWIEGKANSDTIVVSGNIEAHESILSFKSVQSRIVELPFDRSGSTVAIFPDELGRIVSQTWGRSTLEAPRRRKTLFRRISRRPGVAGRALEGGFPFLSAYASP